MMGLSNIILVSPLFPRLCCCEFTVLPQIPCYEDEQDG